MTTLRELREQVGRQRKRVEAIDAGPRRELEQLESDLAGREAPILKLRERRDQIEVRITEVVPILDYWNPRYERLQAIHKELQDLEVANMGYTGPLFGPTTREVADVGVIIKREMIDRLDTIRENVATWRAEQKRIDREIAALEGATE